MADETIWLEVTEADDSAALKYAVVVEWSPEDDAYVASVTDVPEIHTHGATREEAVVVANEVIALTRAAARRSGRAVTPPTFSALLEASPAAAVSPVPCSA